MIKLARSWISLLIALLLSSPCLAETLTTSLLVTKTTAAWHVITLTTLLSLAQTLQHSFLLIQQEILAIPAPSLHLLSIISTLTLLAAYFLRRAALKKIAEKSTELSLFLHTFIQNIYPLAITLPLSIELFCLYFNTSVIPHIAYIAYVASAYALAQTAFRFTYVYLVNNRLDKKYHKMTLRRFTYVASFAAMGLLTNIILDDNIAFDIKLLGMTLVMTPILLSSYGFVLSLLHMNFFRQFKQSVRKVLRTIVSFYFLALLYMLWAGYYPLSLYLFNNSLFTILSITMTSLIITICSRHIDNLNNNKGTFIQTIRQHLSIKHYKTMPELMVLRAAVYITALSLFLFLLLVTWLPQARATDYFYALINGFNLSGLRISPLQIVTGMTLYVLLIECGRYLADYLTKLHQNNGEVETQVAMASIVRYISFAIALVLGLLVTGVNITGLAIIAGALSVGIGLGFQSVVNNFLSGLILLIEKPIKAGDRIIIGNVEGFVKKIRARSTQITTLSKEDVIVPNAELVNTQVTNLMFRDKYSRVSCTVGVAYGSDVDLVMASLLEVAHNHPDVIKALPNQPTALFTAFGDSALQFELLAIIYDVNKKNTIRSDLNRAIDAIFKKRAIVIAFPQRDVHIIQS